MCEDMSATTGTSARPICARSGSKGYSRPPMVSLVQVEHVGGSAESFHSAIAGTVVKPPASDEAAMFTRRTLRASFCDFCDHSPVTT